MEDDTVIKITGTADKPLQLIRRFKNERNPNAAVTPHPPRQRLSRRTRPPSPNDEPASVLLERIRKKRDSDIKIGREVLPTGIKH